MQANEINIKIPKIIAITGGKGGTGKTNIAINLSVALAKKSQKVMLLDADFGLANIDVLLGLNPKNNISDVIFGEKELSDIVLDGPCDVQIVPGSSGKKELAQIDIFTLKGLIDRFDSLNTVPDYLIIDTSAGISDNVVSLLSAASEIIVVVCNEPASLTDAYALIKLMHQNYKKNNFRILANKINIKHDATAILDKLLYVTDKYLNVSLKLIDGIADDPFVKKSNLLRQPVVTEFPNAMSSIIFKSIAKDILHWPNSFDRDGSIEFFSKQTYGY